MGRKAIPKSHRFEVFKRDSFTCQYCGRMSPDVILEIDHIKPVKGGGDNSFMNLVTACFDCNRGKGKKPLSENQVLKQQQAQLKEINERREQLKLLLQWKKELENIESDKVEAINAIISEKINFNLTEFGKKSILNAIKKFGLSNVIDATHTSIRQYFDGDAESASKVLEFIPRICANVERQKENPYLYKIHYIKAIIKNRFGIYNESRLMFALKDIVIDDESYKSVETIAKNAKHWTCFWEWLNDEFDSNF